jgi:hypothetical protein
MLIRHVHCFHSVTFEIFFRLDPLLCCLVQRALVVDASARDRVARVRNAILALAHVRCSISPATIADVHDESVRLGLAAASLLEPRQLQRITQTALGRAAAAAANE